MLHHISIAVNHPQPVADDQLEANLQQLALANG